MQRRTQRLRLFELACKQGHEFEAPVLSDFDYGAFLAYGPGGSVAHLDSLNDPVWDEVTELVEDAYPGFRERGDSKQAELIQAAYSATIDPGPAGPLTVEGLRCPTCGAKPVRFTGSEPARWLEVSSATQDAWGALDEVARRRVVADVVRRLIE